MKKERKAFTLVELVITITIIVILASISFLNIWDYTKNARDTVRISDLDNIVSVMNLSLSTWDDLIKPDNIVSENVKFQETWDLNWIEWEFWEQNFAKYSNLSNLPKDPKLKNNYKYFQSEDWDYYLLEATLENGEKEVRTNSWISNVRPLYEEMDPKADWTCEKWYYLWNEKCRIPWEMELVYRLENLNSAKIILDFKGNYNIVEIDWGDEELNNKCVKNKKWKDWNLTSYWDYIARDNHYSITCDVNKLWDFIVKVKWFADWYWRTYNTVNDIKYRSNLIRINKWDLKRMQTWDLSFAFAYRLKIEYIPNNLDTSNVISMRGTFSNTDSKFLPNISYWDVWNVKYMVQMFLYNRQMIKYNNWLQNWNFRDDLNCNNLTIANDNNNKWWFPTCKEYFNSLSK